MPANPQGQTDPQTQQAQQAQQAQPAPQAAPATQQTPRAAAPATPDVGTALNEFLRQSGISRADLLNHLGATGRGLTTAPANAVDMGKYPNLVYGFRRDPGGPKVRVASNTVPVEEVLAARDADPGGNLLARFRMTQEELDEVLRWADDPDRPGA